METIKHRLLAVITSEVDEQKRFKELEQLTEIDADRWKAVWHDRQRPTAEMIEKIAQQWPDYAYWLACGATDPERGHIAPKTFESRYPIVRGQPQEWATKEKKHMIKLLKQEPMEEVERQTRSKKIEDEVFKIREKQHMPAVYLLFERIMRALGQEAKPELFLLEYDKELREIREARYKYESKLQQEINTYRKRLSESITLEKGLTKLLSLVKSNAS